ncbi:hypothetical protein JFL47_14030 [Haemophilus haemoglobinophilus]|nr:hypothetical protein [Canicola haemoglobinophilus]
MVIAKAGKPQVKIVPLEQPEISTRFGFMTEPSNIPDNFDQMYADEIQALFEGNR